MSILDTSDTYQWLWISCSLRPRINQNHQSLILMTTYKDMLLQPKDMLTVSNLMIDLSNDVWQKAIKNLKVCNKRRFFHFFRPRGTRSQKSSNLLICFQQINILLVQTSLKLSSKCPLFGIFLTTLILMLGKIFLYKKMVLN